MAWDIESYKKIAHLKGHNSAIETVAFNKEGNLLASSERNGNLILWDTATY